MSESHVGFLGSTTGDSRYSLFFGPQEQELFDDYSTELLEIVAETSIKYWRIEKILVIQTVFMVNPIPK